MPDLEREATGSSLLNMVGPQRVNCSCIPDSILVSLILLHQGHESRGDRLICNDVPDESHSRDHHMRVLKDESNSFQTFRQSCGRNLLSQKEVLLSPAGPPSVRQQAPMSTTVRRVCLEVNKHKQSILLRTRRAAVVKKSTMAHRKIHSEKTDIFISSHIEKIVIPPNST